MSKAEKRYLKDVAAQLHCSSAKKTEVLACVQDMIAERGLETAGYDTLAETLGEPGEVAAAYIKQALTPAQRAARRAELRRKKFIRTVLAVELAVILFVALLLTGLAIWNHYARIAYDYGSHVPTYYVESQYADPANWPEGFPFNHN